MKKLLAMLLTVFTFALAGVFYGCGDPYKKARIEVLTGETINFVINEYGESQNSLVKVRVSKMPKNASNKLVSMEIDKDVASIVNSSIVYNSDTGETSFEVKAEEGGMANLVMRAEGGKTATVQIYVEERVRGIQFDSTYKPAIIIGENFVVDVYKINFMPATATNKNIKEYRLIERSAYGESTVGTFQNSVLDKRFTSNLNSNNSYYLRAFAEDGNFMAETQIVAVNKILESDIIVRDEVREELIDKITLAININELSSKNFAIEVSGKTNLKYEIDTSESNLVYTATQNSVDPNRFTVSKQNKGISNIKIKVGYANSFDFYSVTKTLSVEVYEEPVQIVVDEENNLSNAEVNVFTSGVDRDWQTLFVKILPQQTNFKTVNLKITHEQFNKFKFAIFENGGFNELQFTTHNEFKVATFNANQQLYVAKKDALDGEAITAIFTSTRNENIEAYVTLTAREQIDGFTFNKGVDEISFNKEKPQKTILAPLNAQENVIEFSYLSGYSDLKFVYNRNLINITNLVQNRETKSGSFSIVGLVEGETILEIFNGEQKIVEDIRIVVATPARANSNLQILAVENTAIIRTEYVNNNKLLSYLFYNNTANSAPIIIKTSHDDLQASILYYNASIISNKNPNNNVNFNPQTNIVTVSNVHAEAEAELEINVYYYILQANNTYKLVEIHNVTTIVYSPELLESMVGFRYYTDSTIKNKEVISASVVDYATVSYEEAMAGSILDLEIYVKSTRAFTIERVELTNVETFIAYRNLSKDGVYRFKILVGGEGLSGISRSINLTFNIYQQGRETPIAKTFYVNIERREKVTDFEFAESSDISLDNLNNLIMQIARDGETKTINLVSDNKPINFSVVNYSVVEVNPTTLEVINSGSLPINISSTGVVTRVGEGVARITFELANSKILDLNNWLNWEQNPPYTFEGLSKPKQLYVRCYGDNVEQAIFTEYELSTISSLGNYLLANNITLSDNFNLNINSFFGKLNGNNSIIYNLKQNNSLFNSNYGVISNLTILNVNQTISNNDNGVYGVICRNNYGQINNVTVSGTISVESGFNKLLTLGGITGINESNASITNSSIDIELNLNNTDANVYVGAICGENLGTITGEHYNSENVLTGGFNYNNEFADQVPNVTLNIINAKIGNPSEPQTISAGGAVGKNYSLVKKLKAEANVNGQGSYSYLCGVAGGVVGENIGGVLSSVSGSLISNKSLISGGSVVGKTISAGALNELVAVMPNSFIAQSSGAVAGEAQGYNLINNVKVIGFRNQDNTQSSTLNGNRVGLIAGRASQLEVANLSVEDVSLTGTTVGVLVGEIGADINLDENNVDSYLFNLSLPLNQALYEFTTTTTSMPVTDAYGNNVYVWLDVDNTLTKTQLYFNPQNPLYNYIKVDENEEDQLVDNININGHLVEIRELEDVYSSNEFGDKLAKLDATISTNEQQNGQVILINGQSYDLTYVKFNEENDSSIYSYNDGSRVRYVIIDEQLIAHLTDLGVDIPIDFNEFNNLVTINTETISGIAPNTVVVGEQIIYNETTAERISLTYNDQAILTNKFVSSASEFNGFILNNLKQNGVAVETISESNAFGSKVKNLNHVINQTQPETTRFAAQRAITPNEEEYVGFSINNQFSEDVIKSLNYNANFNFNIFDTKQQEMFIGVNSLNSAVSIDLSQIIYNYSNYKISATNGKVYLNNLIVDKQGTIELNLVPYTNQSANSVRLFIYVKELKDPTIVDVNSNEQINKQILIKQGQTNSQLDFVVNANIGSLNVTASHGTLTQNSGVYNLSLNKDEESSIVTVVASVTYTGIDGEVNFIYYTTDFEVKVVSNIKSISSVLSSAEATKNDEIVLTTKIVLDANLSDEDVLEILNTQFDVLTNDLDNKISILKIADYVVERTETETTILVNSKIYFNAVDQVNQRLTYKITSQYGTGENIIKANSLDLTLVPQKLDTISIITNSLYGYEIEDELDLFVDSVVAKVTIVPARFYNDEMFIRVTANWAGAFRPTELKLSQTPNTFNNTTSNTINLVKNEDNLFVFYLRFQTAKSITDLSGYGITLNVEFNRSGGNTQQNYTYSDSEKFYYSLVKAPAIELEFNRYYAENTSRELVLKDAYGNILNYADQSFKNSLAGFEIVVGGESQTGIPHLPTAINSVYRVIRGTDEYSISLINNKFYFSSNALGKNFTINVYSKVELNGNLINLRTSYKQGQIVSYVVESITFTTPNGLQPLDKEIAIDFSVNMSYSPENKASALVRASEIRSMLLSGWDGNVNGEKYVELAFDFGVGNGFESLTPNPSQSQITHNGKFLIMPKKNYKGETSGYALWGLSLSNEPIEIEVSAKIVYNYYGNSIIPEIINYQSGTSESIITSTFSFNFYNISTEENPTPIKNANEFKSLLSGGNDQNPDQSNPDGVVGTERHFRLVNNIFLYDYEPIEANFDSLDGNGFAIYIGSFKLDQVSDNNSISLGLFKEIKQNTIVKNLSIAVNGLNTYLSSGANLDQNVLDLSSYSTVRFGLVTPLNRGYIVNCEVLSFDLSMPSVGANKGAKETSPINLKMTTGTDSVVGTLVAENYGSVVNSRVGRSTNSDYEYFGFGLIGGEDSNGSGGGIGFESLTNSGVATKKYAADINNEYSRIINTNEYVIDEQGKITDVKNPNRFKQNGVDLTASGIIGGLAGINYESGIISSSYFAGGRVINESTVVEESFTGGLVAYNYGTIALSDVEGRFNETQKDISNETDRIIRLDKGIISNGNVGGLVYLNTGNISDCYTNITISTNARSAAFVYNTEEGVVKNSYAFSSSESTTNNAPFVGVEPFETTYKGTIETSYYYKPSLTNNFVNVEPEDRIDNTDVLTRIPDASFAVLERVYTSFAFSQIVYDSNNNAISSKNGVWELNPDYGPYLTSANSIAVSQYTLKRDGIVTEYPDVSGNILSNVQGYIAKDIDNVDNYILIKNAEEFNDRILNGEKDYQSKKLSNPNSIVKKNVYRLISDITFGTPGESNSKANEVIRTTALTFEGVLEGNGLSINNLSITAELASTSDDADEDYFIPSNRSVGMFAALSNGASIKNLNVYVTQVTATTTEIVASVVGILENSFIYNVNVMPYLNTEASINRVSGYNIAAGVVGLVIGDVDSFKISNVTSSVSVTATNTELPATSENQKIENDIYRGFTSRSNQSQTIKNITLEQLKQNYEVNGSVVTDPFGNPVFEYRYNGLSVVGGVVGVTSVETRDNSIVASVIENGAGDNVGYAQISRVKAYGEDLRLTAVNVGGVVGIIDRNVYLHNALFEVTKLEKGETTTKQRLGGTITAGGISIINNGLIKYARIEHANQFELDQIYLSKDSAYNFEQNSASNLFNINPPSETLSNIYIGGITAVNNVGEILDSYVKIDIKPEILGSPVNQTYIGFVAGRSVGGRIGYFYSLGRINENYVSGLIGEALLNTQVREGVDSEYNKDRLLTSSVTQIRHIVINTATVLVPVNTDLNSTKFSILAGKFEPGVFGNQNISTISGNSNYNTTLFNINYTNKSKQVAGDEEELVNINLVGGANSELYMHTQDGDKSVLAVNENNSYTTQVTGITNTFRGFILTLRWNVYSVSQYKMPYPFYGLSDTLKYIDSASKFLELSEFPTATFIVMGKATTGDNEYDYEIDESVIKSSNMQFSGVLTGIPAVKNGKYPKIKFNIGGDATRFFGSINGASISNLNITINSTKDSAKISGGLFGSKATNSQLSDVTITLNNKVNVSGGTNAGEGFGFFVDQTNGTKFTNCGVIGNNKNENVTLSNLRVFGGLVGQLNTSTIENSYVNGLNIKIDSINNNATFGGLVGTVGSSTIQNSWVVDTKVSNIASSNNVLAGGFVGSSLAGNEVGLTYITGSYVLTSNIDKLGNVGGFIGNASNITINYCFADSTITNVASAGGFAYSLSKGSSITSSYAKGSIQSNEVGGFVYTTAGEISGCYTTSSIENLSASNYNLAGFANKIIDGSITDVFTLSEITGDDAYENTNKKIRNFAISNAKKDNIFNAYYSSELNYKYNLINTNSTYKINDEFKVDNLDYSAGEIAGTDAKSFVDFIEGKISYNNSNSKFYNVEDSNGFKFAQLLKNNESTTAEMYLQQQTNNLMLIAKIAERNSDFVNGKIIYIGSEQNTTIKGIELENKIVVGKTRKDTEKSHFTISGQTPLFSSVKNSIVTNVWVDGQNANSQSLFASNVENSMLNKIVITGNINPAENTAGSIAKELKNSLLINSRNTATVTASDKIKIGGLVGVASNSNIINSYNAGEVRGESQVGGLVGFAQGKVEIYKCYNIAKVFGNFDSGEKIGGLVGNYAETSYQNNLLNIENCYNAGLLTGNKNMGGLAWLSLANNQTPIKFVNCYNTGAINVRNRGDNNEYFSPIANILNNNFGTSNNIYNIDLFNGWQDSQSIGFEGVSTRDLLTFANKKEIGEGENKVTTQWGNGDFIHVSDPGKSFPLLQNVGGHSGVVVGGQAQGFGANLIPVASADDFYITGLYNPNANYVLTKNIDSSRSGAYSETFTGYIYGAEYTIYNRSQPVINKGENAVITNLKVMGSAVESPTSDFVAIGNLNASVVDTLNGGFISNVMFTGDIDVSAANTTETNAYAGSIVANLLNATVSNVDVIETDIYQYLQNPQQVGISNVNTITIGGIVGKSENSNILNSNYSGNIYLARGYRENGANGFGSVNTFNIGGIVGETISSTIKSNNVQHQVYYATESKNFADDDAIDNQIIEGSQKINNLNTLNNYNLFKGSTINASTGKDAFNNNALQSLNLQQQKTITSINKTAGKWANSDFSGASYKSPTLVYDAEDFAKISANKYYKLVGNIKGSKNEISNKLGSLNYLDGRGFVVSNITFNANAMFEDFGKNTVFKNIVLEDIKVNATSEKVVDEKVVSSDSAMLTVNNSGEIKYVGFVKGVLTVTNANGSGNTSSDAGSYTSSVSNYNTGTVGSVSATNLGEISYCYSTATISIEGASNGTVGGLVGRQIGKLKHNYYSGLIALPFDPESMTNKFAVSGTFTITQIGDGVVAYDNFCNDELYTGIIDQTSSNDAMTSVKLSQKVIDNFDVRATSANPLILGSSSQNAGLPKCNKHKNFKTYNTFAFSSYTDESIEIEGKEEFINISQWDEFVSESKKSKSKFKLLNNIICDTTLDQPLLKENNSFTGQIDFNGYCIINLRISTNFSGALFYQCRSAKFYNPQFINPLIETKGYTSYYSSIKVSVLTVEAKGDVIIKNPIIVGGGLNVYQQDYKVDAISKIKYNETNTDYGSMSDIYVDPVVNVKIFDDNDIDNALFSSSVKVRTGSITTENLQIGYGWVSNTPNDHPEEFKVYKKFINYWKKWDANYKPKQTDTAKDIKSGDVKLANVFVDSNNEENKSTNLIYVYAGYGKTGFAHYNTFYNSYEHRIDKDIDINGEYEFGVAKSGDVKSVNLNNKNLNSKIQIIKSEIESTTGDATPMRLIVRIRYWGSTPNWDKELKAKSGKEYAIKGSISDIKVNRY